MLFFSVLTICVTIFLIALLYFSAKIFAIKAKVKDMRSAKQRGDISRP